MKIKRNKIGGFTLIELLTVIAILAIILLISIPIILGVLDRARKNSFKNQVLLYVEALKQQTGMALMGSGYSELKSVDNSFYAPTSDSDNKLVRVSVSNLNKVMDNVALTNDDDKYFYVEYTDTGYNYYIGEGVRKEGEFSTTCEAATGNEACTAKTYDEENINLINSKVFNLVHITRNDVVASSSGSGSQTVTLPAPTVEITGNSATLEVGEGITEYCITTSSSSGSCSFESVENNETIDLTQNTDGTYYIFVKNAAGNISEGVEYTVSTPLVIGNNGDAVELGGYKWHIIGQDDDNIWLLMDAFDGNGTATSNRQIANMKHCNTGSSSNCTWNGSYYVYSWDNSLIRSYLNQDTEGGFLYTLPSNVKNKLVTTDVCSDPSLNSSNDYSYGGYTKVEITELQKNYPSITCNSGYTGDKVRLISKSEYYNLTNYSSFASTITYPVAAPGGNGKGYIPRVSYITNRVTDSSWLYSSTIGQWWTMSPYVSSNNFSVKMSLTVYNTGQFQYEDGSSLQNVRPVIVLQK